MFDIISQKITIALAKTPRRTPRFRFKKGGLFGCKLIRLIEMLESLDKLKSSAGVTDGVKVRPIKLKKRKNQGKTNRSLLHDKILALLEIFEALDKLESSAGITLTELIYHN